VVDDGAGNLKVVNADISNNGKISEIIWIDQNDGSFVRKMDVSKWWVNLTEGDSKVGGQYTGGPTAISVRNGLMALGSFNSCTNSLMDISQTTVDASTLWVNGNGDIIGDHNWETTAQRPWVCNDYNVGPEKYCTSMDNQGFVIFAASFIGTVSFGLLAPDGTGIAYKAYAGETDGAKQGFALIDYASSYDGIYSGANGVLNSDGKTYTIAPGYFFTGYDSIKGTISSSTGVDEAPPAAFAVEQNTPNPFNPTTSISFTLAKAEKVTVEIYNAAGQKVDTLVDTTMNAGNHFATWNASKFAAGVYFTVKSGDVSKTMNMTFLK
jgi:hypothetical protein